MIQGSVFIAVSLDGYIARTDGTIDWLSVVERPGEDYGFADFFGHVDLLVMGRNTYETAIGFDPWPYTGKRCVVMTRRPLEPRHGETVFAGEPRALMARLAEEGVRRVYVDGGEVIRQFIAAGLIDDLTLSVIPVTLGSGVRLFAGGEGEQRWRLESSRGFDSGLVQLRYRRGSTL